MTFTLSILRPDDLLNLRVTCVGLRIAKDNQGQSRLVPESDDQAHLIFTFPPQSITERAYYDAAEKYDPPDPDDGGDYNDAPQGSPPVIGDPDAPGDAPARISGQSRLVFRLNEKARSSGIPLTIDGLLDWTNLELVVTQIADIPKDAESVVRGDVPGIRPPGALETAIELPYRLFISPASTARWRHAGDPVTHGGRTELWHTAIVRDDGKGKYKLTGPRNTEPLRAIWSPDYNPANPPDFGVDDPALQLTSMAPYDRHQIVILTCDFHNYIDNDRLSYVPAPFEAEQLLLSPLGGWLKSRGNWDPPFLRKPIRHRPDFPWIDIITHFPRTVTRATREELQPRSPRPSPILAERNPLAELLGGAATAAGSEPLNMRAGSFPSTGSIGDIAISGVGNVFVDIGTGWPWIVLPEKGKQLDLSEWVHVATQGRDHYVRIVYEGRLYPFGHRAALIKITERKFRNFVLPNGANTPVAYMVQKMYIVVREPVCDFSDANAASLSNNGRGMPLKKVRLTTTVTPTISYPYSGVPPVPGANGVFWVMVDDANSDPIDFLFNAVGTDVAGNETDFTTPLIFVPNSRCDDAGDLEDVRKAYANSGERRACRSPGGKVTLAQASANGETTSVESDALYFETEPSPSSNGEVVRSKFFTPRLYKARVYVPAAAAITGARTATTIAFYQDYLTNDFAGAGEVFARVVKDGPEQGGFPTLVDDVLSAGFSADKAGGIATPNMSVSSLSRKHGPLAGDIVKAAANTFDPSSFFPKGLADAAKLFGSFSLEDLIKLAGGGQTMDKDAPKMRVRPTPGPPPKIIAEFDWHPNVSDVDVGIVKFVASDNGSAATLDITGTIETLVGGAGPGASKSLIEGKLKNFRIEFISAVYIHFVEFGFKSASGAKPDVSVQLNSTKPVSFVGDLEFVETLRSLIPPGLLGDGPTLDINTERVHAGFSVALPPASVGIFALSNIRLGAFVELPFAEGRPLFDFSFAQRQDPFTLAVTIFGGTGFFHIQLDTDGLRLLEAALEFGAMAALDIGVASGSVHVLAGIYFTLEKKQPGDPLVATLSGYMRMGGQLRVLCIVSVSVEFVLSFMYSDGKASGRATLTVCVEVLFFSATVELSVERRFGKDGGDPFFHHMLPVPDLWSEYAEAFA